MTRTIYVAYNSERTEEFLTETERSIFLLDKPNFQTREYEQEIIEKIRHKTAKDYKDFADNFFLDFSQDCIEAKNSIETNDAIENHFADMNNALRSARLDKFYFLLLNSQPLLPFYTQEVKDRYLAKLQEFLNL